MGLKGPPDAEGLVEIGYSVLETHQRRGYATEAVRALIAWAKERGAKRIAAETLPELLPSQRVMDKLGMRPVESAARDCGVWLDTAR